MEAWGSPPKPAFCRQKTMLAEKIRCLFLQVSFHRYPGISSKGISAMTSVKTVLSKPCALSFSFFAILVKLRYIRGHLSTNHLSQLAVIAFSCPFCLSNVNHIESHPIFRINFFLYSTPSFPTANGQPQWLPLCPDRRRTPVFMNKKEGYWSYVGNHRTI